MQKGKGGKDEASKRVLHLRYNGVADWTADVVEVNIDAIRAAGPEPGRDVVLAVVDGCREAQIFHQSFTLLIRTTDPHHPHAPVQPADLEKQKPGGANQDLPFLYSLFWWQQRLEYRYLDLHNLDQVKMRILLRVTDL